MINKVILIGNVGADPEVRTLESGVKMARLRIATTERIYNRESQEARDHTEWHTLVVWRNLADVVDRYVRKGSQIYVEGRLRSREWTDQQGQKRYSIEVAVDDLKMLGRRSDNQQSGGSHEPRQNWQSGQNGQGWQGGGQSGQGWQSGSQSYDSHLAPADGGYRQQPAVSPAPDVHIDDDPDDLPF